MEGLRLKLKEYKKYIDIFSDILTIFLFILLLVSLFIFPVFSVVMSESMQHDHFNISKYRIYNITPSEIKKWPFHNGISKGSIVILIPASYKDIKEGDVILYYSPYFNKLILHRAIKVIHVNNTTKIIVMGDNNPYPLPGENPVNNSWILGKAIFVIPYLGYPKVFLCENLKIKFFC